MAQTVPGVEGLSLDRVWRRGWLLVGLAVFGGLLARDLPVVVGLGAGGALSLLSFRRLRRIVEVALGAEDGRRVRTLVRCLAEFLGIYVAAYLVIRFLPAAPLAFALGFSAVVLAAVWETVALAWRRGGLDPC
ncbi:MAG: ATP synthase subunit I [Deltaproteobacteria bacterium]|nr:ATP synthase subunit I [Deltaproteobacteria bacterium]